MYLFAGVCSSSLLATSRDEMPRQEMPKTQNNELMWAHAFRTKTVEFRINTNNGLERQHETLKHSYLRGYRNCTLSELFEVLHTHFF